MPRTRKHFPDSVVNAVLIDSRRRCALCFGLDGDATEKEGQIAHVDRDGANISKTNAAWLCTKHHGRYDSRSKQTKGHTPEELKTFRKMLYQYMSSPTAWPDAGSRPTHGSGVSLEVFERRVPTYRATLSFLRVVIRGKDLDLGPIFQFAADTDEALFLFDDDLAAYLAELYRRAVHLHAVYAQREAPEGWTSELSKEWVDAMNWFSEQFEESRRRFAPYLRLSNGLANQRLQPTAREGGKRRPREGRG